MDFGIKENREEFLGNLENFYKDQMALKFDSGKNWWFSSSGLFTQNCIIASLWLCSLHFNEPVSNYFAFIVVVSMLLNLYLMNHKDKRSFVKESGSLILKSERDDTEKKLFIDGFLRATGRNFYNADDLTSIYELLKRKVAFRKFPVQLIIVLPLLRMGIEFFDKEYVNRVQFHILSTGVTVGDILIYPALIILVIYLIAILFRKDKGYEYIKDLVSEIREDVKTDQFQLFN